MSLRAVAGSASTSFFLNESRALYISMMGSRPPPVMILALSSRVPPRDSASLACFILACVTACWTSLFVASLVPTRLFTTPSDSTTARTLPDAEVPTFMLASRAASMVLAHATSSLFATRRFSFVTLRGSFPEDSFFFKSFSSETFEVLTKVDVSVVGPTSSGISTLACLHACWTSLTHLAHIFVRCGRIASPNSATIACAHSVNRTVPRMILAVPHIVAARIA